MFLILRTFLFHLKKIKTEYEITSVKKQHSKTISFTNHFHQKSRIFLVSLHPKNLNPLFRIREKRTEQTK